MWSRIKNFLDRWNLTPILCPVREDGFLQFLPAIFGAGKGIADLFKGKKEQEALTSQIWLNNEARQKRQGMFGDWMSQMGGPEALLGATPRTTSQGSSTSSTRSAFDKDIKHLSKKDLQLALGARRRDVTDAASEGRGRMMRDLGRLAQQERALAGAVPAGTSGPAGRSNALQQIKQAMIAPRLDVMGEAEDRMRSNRLGALDALENLAGLQTGERGTSVSDTTGSTFGTSTSQDPIGNFARLFGAAQQAYGPMESPTTGRAPTAEALSGIFGGAAQLPWDQMFKKSPKSDPYTPTNSAWGGSQIFNPITAPRLGG